MTRSPTQRRNQGEERVCVFVWVMREMSRDRGTEREREREREREVRYMS